MKLIYISLICLLFSCNSQNELVDTSKVKPAQIGFHEIYALNELRTNFQNAYTYSELTDSSHTSSLQMSSLLHDYSPFDMIVKVDNKPVLDSILAIQEIRAKFPVDLFFSYSNKPEQIDNQSYYHLYMLKKPMDQDDLITGSDIETVESTFDENYAMQIISLGFNLQGSKKFAELTRKNIGRGIAITLDGQLLSCPIVEDEISNGKVQITGGFTKQEADNLVLALKAGQKWKH